mgnify:CR=1 FL=1
MFITVASTGLRKLSSEMFIYISYWTFVNCILLSGWIDNKAVVTMVSPFFTPSMICTKVESRIPVTTVSKFTVPFLYTTTCLFLAWGIMACVGTMTAWSFWPNRNDTFADEPGTSRGLDPAITVSTCKVRVFSSMRVAVAKMEALNFLSLPATVKSIRF